MRRTEGKQNGEDAETGRPRSKFVHYRLYRVPRTFTRQRCTEGSRPVKMAANPPPADAATAQAVVDKNTGLLRVRGNDERTHAGTGIDHNKYIVCPALGVSSCARCALRRFIQARA